MGGGVQLHFAQKFLFTNGGILDNCVGLVSMQKSSPPSQRPLS